MIDNNFKKVGDKLLFVGTYMEVYIPEDFFDASKAKDVNDIKDIFGVFNFKIFNSVDSKYTDSDKIHTFVFPSRMNTKPDSTEKRKMVLMKGHDEQVFYVCKYYTNSEIMCSTKVVKSVNNVEAFIKMLLNGKLPNTIRYTDLIGMFKDNIAINGVNLGVPDVVMELMIAEICRSDSDTTKPFRLAYNKHGNEYLYRPVNPVELAAISSTFAAITFENFDMMSNASINRHRYNEKSQESPIEVILKA